MHLSGATEMTSPEALDDEIFRLHASESDATLALGHARLRGHSGGAARAELRRIREDLEAVCAASRVLASQAGVR